MEKCLQTTTLYMLVGIPGSGKSFWSAKLASQGVHVHSSDAIRAELFHDADCQEKPYIIFQELGRRILAFW